MAPSGLYLCSRSYKNLASKFQEKFKENRLSISSTWQTNHKCVTDQVLSGKEQRAKMLAACVPTKDYHQSWRRSLLLQQRSSV